MSGPLGGTDPAATPGPDVPSLLAGHDWSSNPLGAPAGWSASLRTTVGLLLRARFPMCLVWGEERVVLYNDPFVPTLGAKHPDAFGADLAVVFAEVWDRLGAVHGSVLRTGRSTYAEDVALVIDRGHGPEETFYTLSYSKVDDDAERAVTTTDAGSGGSDSKEANGGVLAVLAETTGTVVGARRLALLNRLATASSDVTRPEQAAAEAVAVLAGATQDLVGAACFLPAGPGAAATEPAASFGPADLVTGTGAVALADRALRDDGSTAPPGASDPDRRVVLTVPGRDGPAAALVLVPHPLRPLDDEHTGFLEGVRDHLGHALALARARDVEQSRLAALAELDAAKSSFLSQVSHEFRTPLTLLLGPLEDALDGGSEALTDDVLESMHGSAHRLLRMVNALLDVARMDAGAPVTALEATDLAALTTDLLRPFGSAADRSGLVLDLRLEDDLVVAMDPRLWETILLNLVANAIKYTPRGRVEVHLGVRRDTLVLQVADTGVGIPPDQLDRVFERFHRVRGASQGEVEGTGLGLALVADAVDALGGVARVQSRLGAGSMFQVVLPRRPPEDLGADERPAGGTAADRRRARAAATAMAGELAVPDVEVGGQPAPEDALPGRPRILVVDDNPALRVRVARLLDEIGVVTTCADGQEALDHLRAAGADLVVTDVMMPRLDGVGLLQSVRADPALARTPVVVLSARAGEEAARGALESGADDYVVKPFTRGELLARCRSTLELAQLREQHSADRARATLLAGVSHDMQTPLSVITAALTVLSEPDTDPAVRAELGSRAQARADQLGRLVRQFLDWSRLVSGVPLAPRLEETDLLALVSGVVELYEATLVPPDPSGPAPVVRCDPQRTEQVLHNLLANATSATRGRIEVRLVPGEEGGWDVEVRDDGGGIANEVLPRLFAAFGPTEGQRGNGLGLHVSRAAARAQGGDLVLSETNRGGSVFVLHLVIGN